MTCHHRLVVVCKYFRHYAILSCWTTLMCLLSLKIQKQSFKKGRKEKRSFKIQRIINNFTSNRIYFGDCFIFRILIITVCLTSFPMVKATSFYSNIKYGNNTVKTKYGLLRGIIVRSAPLVEAYLGIPYASPPIGSLRYMPPITPSSWKNTRNADRFSPVCPQTVPMPPNGPEALLDVPRARLVQFRRLFPLLSNQSEDCLYLNMYIPKASSSNNNEDSYPNSEVSSTINAGKSQWNSKRLSTLVFIHGESYEWNSGNLYDGSQLAAQGNLIIVTINFRLGILGFLKTGGKESAQGNFGLMDLVAGVYWLKENLPAFGGDSNKITVMGHGTGAALANILLVSPVSSDLFLRGILLSGSALSPWAIQKSPLYVKRRVAKQTGCHGDLLYDDLAPCLRTKKLSDLLAVKVDYARYLSGFAPFVDGTVITQNIHSHTVKLPLGSAILSSSDIDFANFLKQDLLFGLTSVESYLDLSAQDLEYGLNETHKDRILRTFVRNVFNYHLNEIFAVLKNEYTDWERGTHNPFSSRDATLAFLSDGHTASPLIKIAQMHSLRGGRSYFLHFRHKTNEEEYPLRSGSVHGEDIPFWFGLPISPLFPQNYSSQERNLSMAMVQYLSNFVKTGNPNLSTTYINRKNRTDFIDDPKTNFSANNITSNSLAHLTTVYQTPHSQLSLDLDSSFTKREEKSSKSQSNPKRSTDREQFGQNTYIHKRHSSFDSIIYDKRIKKKYITNGLPYWEIYDSVNQLYLEMGHNAEIHSHYRVHKLSMWLNLIPQLHKSSNIKDTSIRHNQFVEKDAQYYEGSVRGHLQSKPLDDEKDPFVYTEKSSITNRELGLNSKNLDQKDATNDCLLNITQFSILTVPTPFINITTNTSEGIFNVLGSSDVIQRLNGKQLQSYSTVLAATVAVGCFLFILNVFVFAAIYYSRKKRVSDARKEEKMEKNEIYTNQSTAKNTLNSRYFETSSKELLDANICFDQKVKENLPDDDHEMIEKENTCIYSTNTTNITDIQHLNGNFENKGNTFAKHATKYIYSESNDLFLENDFFPLTPTIAYQPINEFFESKQEIITQEESIPNPHPPPKFISQRGVSRATEKKEVSSYSKKSVHVQEISV